MSIWFYTELSMEYIGNSCWLSESYLFNLDNTVFIYLITVGYFSGDVLEFQLANDCLHG